MRGRSPPSRPVQHALPAVAAEPTLAALVRLQTGAAWSRARRLCVEGRVTLNGARCLDPAMRVAVGAVVAIDAQAPKLRAGPLPGNAIVHADRDLVVVDKPAGMLSVPDEPGTKGTLADFTRALLRALGRGQDTALSVVHRLDRDTSGLIVLARTAEAKRRLAAQFRAHDIERVYHAIAHGDVEATRVETMLVQELHQAVAPAGFGGVGRVVVNLKRLDRSLQGLSGGGSWAATCPLRSRTQQQSHRQRSGRPQVPARS